MTPPHAEWDGFGPDPDADASPDYLEVWAHPPAGHGPTNGAPVVGGDPPPLPVVQIVEGELPRMVEQACTALARGDRNLFRSRAGGLVTIVREPKRADPPCEGRPSTSHPCETCGSWIEEPCVRARRHGNSALLRPGTPRIHPLGPAALTLRSARVTRWQRFDGRRGKKGEDKQPTGMWIPADPSTKALGILIADPTEWSPVQPLAGMLEAPTLAPSGRIISAPGYDAETGYVLIPSCVVPEVKEHPTEDDAREALAYLWTNLFADFPYRGLGESTGEADPERALHFHKAKEIADAFVGLAALLTMLARPAIDGAIPGIIQEAAAPGSGKSLQMHVVAIAATGRPAGVMTFPMRDGKADEQELEKVLSSYALAGARLICFDNIRGTLGGQRLENALTSAETIDLRVLGASDMRTLPWGALLMFSGNNMSVNDDTSERTLMSRLESPRERPRARPASAFRHPHLLPWVKKNRGPILAAALTILRAAVVAREGGKLPKCDRMGSFETWSELIPPAIMFAGGPNVLAARPCLVGALDDEGAAHATMMRLWPTSWQGQRAAAIAAECTKAEEERRQSARHGVTLPPDANGDELRASLRVLTRTREGAQIHGHALGIRLGKLRGKIRDGMRLTATEDTKTKIQLWSVERAEGSDGT